MSPRTEEIEMIQRMLVAGAALAFAFACTQQGQQGQEQQQQEQQQQPPGQEGQQQPSAQQPSGEQAAMGQQQTTTGTVTEVQDTQLTMRTGANEEIELQVSDDAEITQDGRPIALEQVQQGASVRASWTERDGQMRLQRLEVQRSVGSPGLGEQPGEPLPIDQQQRQQQQQQP